jgi:RNA polymerase sigma factor (sigma-70 family)
MAQRRYVESQKRSTRREFSLDAYFHTEANALPAGISSPSKHFMRAERTELVESALTRLPEHYQQIIELRHRHALPFDAIARQLELSPDAARQRWTWAIRRLQKELRAADVI